jgi:hypothetical protein
MGTAQIEIDAAYLNYNMSLPPGGHYFKARLRTKKDRRKENVFGWDRERTL